MNNIFIITLVIITIGHILKRLNIIKENEGETLSKLLINLTIPALLFSNFCQAELDAKLALMPLIAILYNLLIIAVGMVIFRNCTGKLKGMLVMLGPVGNGLFFFPLVEAMWGSQGLVYFGMYDIGNAFTLFCISYYIANYYANEEGKIDYRIVGIKMLKSAPLMTYFLVIIIKLIGLQIPEIIIQVTQTISKANLPLSFILFGLYLDFSFTYDYIKNILKVITIRYVLGLAIGITLLFYLPFPDLPRYIILCALILPTAAVLIPYALEFNYDVKFVAAVSNITIIISFFLLWVIAGRLSLL
ncbi:MAG: AEC family transporter [Syntrophomonadaceae bacterium]|jgi:predicted permease